MPRTKDPLESIRAKALALPGVVHGSSCNQDSFKVGKGSFLFAGPGAKGVGFKAMFRLDASLAEARRLAAAEPDRYEVGSTGWVTARFTAGNPLPAALRDRWIRESWERARGGRTVS